MNKEKLENELLEKINGGEVRENIIQQIISCVPMYINFNIDKQRMIEVLNRMWNEDPLKLSTDGSQEDYDKLLQLILDEFKKYNR